MAISPWGISQFNIGTHVVGSRLRVLNGEAVQVISHYNTSPTPQATHFRTATSSMSPTDTWNDIGPIYFSTSGVGAGFGNVAGAMVATDGTTYGAAIYVQNTNYYGSGDPITTPYSGTYIFSASSLAGPWTQVHYIMGMAVDFQYLDGRWIAYGQTHSWYTGGDGPFDYAHWYHGGPGFMSWSTSLTGTWTLDVDPSPSGEFGTSAVMGLEYNGTHWVRAYRGSTDELQYSTSLATWTGWTSVSHAGYFGGVRYLNGYWITFGSSTLAFGQFPQIGYTDDITSTALSFVDYNNLTLNGTPSDARRITDVSYQYGHWILLGTMSSPYGVRFPYRKSSGSPAGAWTSVAPALYFSDAATTSDRVIKLGRYLYVAHDNGGVSYYDPAIQPPGIPGGELFGDNQVIRVTEGTATEPNVRSYFRGKSS